MSLQFQSGDNFRSLGGDYVSQPERIYESDDSDILGMLNSNFDLYLTRARRLTFGRKNSLKILDEQENLPPKYWRKLYTSPYHGPLGFEDGEISQRRFGPNQERSSVVFMPRDLDDYMIAPYKFVWRRNSKFELGLVGERITSRPSSIVTIFKLITANCKSITANCKLITAN